MGQCRLCGFNNCHFCLIPGERGGGRGDSLQWPIRRAPPEGGTFFRFQVYKRVGKSVIWVFERAFNQNISNRRTLWLSQFIY